MFSEPLDDISPISIHRVLPGGQSTGHLSVRMHNRDVNPAKLLWMETLPWFITLYLHTMTPIWTGSSELVIGAPHRTLHDYLSFTFRRFGKGC